MRRRHTDRGGLRVAHASAAFTLAELLVTLGILTVLISLLLPALTSARNSARRIRCAEQLRGFGQAMANYANDSKGHLYPHTDFGTPTHVELWAEPLFGEDLVWAAVDKSEYSWLLVCPEDPFDGNPDPSSPSRNSYLLNHLLDGLQVRQHGPYEASPADIVLMGEKRPDAVGWLSGACYTLTVTDPEWYEEIDLVRHGEKLRSNHLFLDLHVDNRDISVRIQRVNGNYNPWDYGFVD